MLHRDEPAPASSSELGLTLIELIVASAMMVVIVGATVSMLVSALPQQSELTSQADKVGDTRQAADLMVRDLRQATEVVSGTAARNGLQIKTYIHASTCAGGTATATVAKLCKVTYSCSTSTSVCTRTPEGGTARTVATGVQNAAEVFCYMPSSVASTCAASVGTPAYVGVTLKVKAKSGPAIVIEDGTTLRGTAANLAR